MNDVQVLSSIRSFLMNKESDWRIHLTLPPKAIYPLMIIELEELWSPFPFRENDKRKDVQGRVKFKVSIFSRLPGLEEVAYLSHKTRNILEGATMPLFKEKRGQTTITIRFLSCVNESNSTNSSSTNQGRVMHQYYDCLIRG